MKSSNSFVTPSAQTSAFAALLANLPAPVVAQPGTLVKGKVYGDLISFGGKEDGQLTAKERKEVTLEEGKEYTFLVLGGGYCDEDDEQPDGALVPLSFLRGAAWEKVLEATKEDRVITVRGVRVSRKAGGIPTGLLVSIEGVRGFLPSRFSGVPNDQLGTLIGKELPVKIVEADLPNNKLIVDHRQARTALREAAYDNRLATLKTGDIVTGKVVGIQAYGCFVDIGEGVHGLVHNTEGGSGLKVGQEVTAVVARCDLANRKLSLNVKEASYARVFCELKQGDEVSGTVVNTVEYGVFVRLDGYGVDALLHVSQMADQSARPGKGDRFSGRLHELDAQRKRIGVTQKPAKAS